MRIIELTAYSVRLPFKRPFKHASAQRSESENLIVRCRLADGTTGYGEGVPRSYVTGETIEGAQRQLAETSLATQLGRDCMSWPDVIALCEGFTPTAKPNARQCESHAVRCAVELSVLDAFGRLFREPLYQVVREYAPARSLWRSPMPVRYSTTIGIDTPWKERLSAMKMRLYGFAHCKLKIGAPGMDDAARLRRIRQIVGPAMDLRVDVNEAWPAADLPARVEPLLTAGISCLEQPVSHAEVKSLATLRSKLGVPVMLDESLITEADAETAIADRTCDLFNLRLSKCGGFLSTLRLAARACAAGLGFQLGCHPGESGLLSAAGRHFASAVRDVRYVEGSYDRHLLKTQLTEQDITFGYGGRAPPIHAPGLGVTVNPERLAALTTHEAGYRIH